MKWMVWLSKFKWLTVICWKKDLRYRCKHRRNEAEAFSESHLSPLTISWDSGSHLFANLGLANNMIIIFFNFLKLRKRASKNTAIVRKTWRGAERARTRLYSSFNIAEREEHYRNRAAEEATKVWVKGSLCCFAFASFTSVASNLCCFFAWDKPCFSYRDRAS